MPSFLQVESISTCAASDEPVLLHRQVRGKPAPSPSPFSSATPWSSILCPRVCRRRRPQSQPSSSHRPRSPPPCRCRRQSAPPSPARGPPNEFIDSEVKYHGENRSLMYDERKGNFFGKRNNMEIAGAWLHTHKMQQGINGDRLCSQSASNKWEQYVDGMEKKHGPNWQAWHPHLDAGIVYETEGRMPHCRLGVGDEAISICQKEAIKTRKRGVQQQISSVSVRPQRKIERLRREYTCYRGLERVMRALAAKEGMNYDALVRETGSDMEMKTST